VIEYHFNSYTTKLATPTASINKHAAIASHGKMIGKSGMPSLGVLMVVFLVRINAIFTQVNTSNMNILAIETRWVKSNPVDNTTTQQITIIDAIIGVCVLGFILANI